MTVGVHAAPLISFSGGGTNGESLFINFTEDFTLAVKPGTSVSGYMWGLSFPTNTMQNVFSSVYIQPSPGTLLSPSEGARLQVTNGAPPVFLTNVGFTAYMGSSSTISFTDYNEYILQEGGTITFTKGSIEIANNSERVSGLGYYVLNQQNVSFELSPSYIWGSSEIPPGFNAANFELVPEPSTYALVGLGALGLVIACRRRIA